MNDARNLVLGIDYGSDSCRAVLVDTSNGAVLASAVHAYERWKSLSYCQPSINQFRQHPLDYLEGLEYTIKEVLKVLDKSEYSAVKAISVDTTGSTPVAVNEQGVPLSLTPEFAENPNAMFVLWKDHTAIEEADQINELAKNWDGEDFTKYEGGIYSSEWFWAKVLHVSKQDEAVKQAAFSWIEHCDWIPFVLTGSDDILSFKRSRCAAGHKAMWHQDWGGLPPKEFLTQLDPYLADLRDRLYGETFTAEETAGTLCGAWAQRLGLSEDTIITVGTFDAHAGAVGGEVRPNTLVKVMGTSTCDMIVATPEEVCDNCVSGICGQVDGSIIPHFVGLEAGQSGFGDVLAWFRNMLSWPLKNLGLENTEALIDQIIPKLSEQALEIPVADSKVVSLDWINGRRTPDANQLLKGAITGLNMGTDAVKIFKSLVEAICFGSRAIVDRFESEGVKIDQVVGLGGVAKKSKLVMQTMADVLNRPIKVMRSDQAPALGASMYAAVAAGIYPDVLTAMNHISNGVEQEYQPIAANVEVYERLYQEYSKIGSFIEEHTESKKYEQVQIA
ncbi:ribulokinase [Sediminitomix flava]|uniref:Ribulokinase n=1 Tax=Sediminitomix flava TaxID=379075 RepID=A0A315YYH1_SEDFL|nr:ribulokinase [Sediminitomix flava]PWJ34996.1 L-ribulokinase [Sediminitomix flava]